VNIAWAGSRNLRIEVVDTGIGMSVRTQAGLFENIRRQSYFGRMLHQRIPAIGSVTEPEGSDRLILESPFPEILENIGQPHQNGCQSCDVGRADLAAEHARDEGGDGHSQNSPYEKKNERMHAVSLQHLFVFNFSGSFNSRFQRGGFHPCGAVAGTPTSNGKHEMRVLQFSLDSKISIC
jgi:hypothetical protein